MVAKVLQPSPVDSVPRLSLTRSEAAEALGVSVNTIDAWIRNASLPHLKVGRCVLFPVHELEKWLSDNVTGIDR